MIIKYIILGFVFAAGIGPVNIETAKRGFTEHWSSAGFFYLGNLLIDALYIILIMFGFALIDNQLIKIIFGVLGIAYLFYLGIGDIKDYFRKHIFTKKKELKRKHKFHPTMEGILVNLANPMAIASWLAFYGVVAIDFEKSFFNFFAVVLGAAILGGVIVLVTHFFKQIVGEKVMCVISLISGIALISFSFVFAYNLVKLMVEL